MKQYKNMHPDDVMILKGLKLKISNYILKEMEEQAKYLEPSKPCLMPLDYKSRVGNLTIFPKIRDDNLSVLKQENRRLKSLISQINLSIQPRDSQKRDLETDFADIDESFQEKRGKSSETSSYQAPPDAQKNLFQIQEIIRKYLDFSDTPKDSILE